MNTSCYAVNIRSTIDRNDNAYIGEEALNLLIDGFSCPPNLEVEHFLKHSALEMARHIVGGVVEFLECEDNPFLLDFYAENGFKAFDRRTVTPSDNEPPHELVQLLRFL